MHGDLGLASVWTWLAILAVVLGLPGFLGLAVGRLPAVKALFRGDRTTWFTFWWLTLLTLWLVVAALLLVFCKARVPLTSIGFIPPSNLEALGLLALTSVLLVFALWASPTIVTPGPTTAAAVILPHTRAERLFMVAIIAPSAAFCEELAYRGLLLTVMTPTLGTWPANTLQALLFGFHHGGLKQGGIALLIRATIGFGFGLVTIWTGSLLSAMVLHFVIDALTALRPVRKQTAEG
jgi:membrane protease YdiL (CAAX protease family)